VKRFYLVTVRDGGKTLRISAHRAVVRSLFISAAKGNSSAQRTTLNAIREIEGSHGDNNPPPVVISWLEPASTAANTASLREQLDLSRLTQEQLDKFKELLSIAIKKDGPESE
jgi:hypothetical protein